MIDLDCGVAPLDGVGMYIHWLIHDGPVAPDRNSVIALADFVNQFRRSKKRILIHCAGGLNRSGVLVAATLVRSGLHPAEAIETVRSGRPGALDNPEFVRFLLEDMTSEIDW